MLNYLSLKQGWPKLDPNKTCTRLSLGKNNIQLVLTNHISSIILKNLVDKLPLKPHLKAGRWNFWGNLPHYSTFFLPPVSLRRGKRKMAVVLKYQRTKEERHTRDQSVPMDNVFDSNRPVGSWAVSQIDAATTTDPYWRGVGGVDCSPDDPESEITKN